MVKKITQLLPALTIVLIILSLIKQVLFYHYFNVPILSYITFSELTVLVAKELLFISPIAIAYTFSIYLYVYLRKVIENEFPRKPFLKYSVISVLTILIGIVIFFELEKISYTSILISVTYFIILSAFVFLWFSNAFKNKSMLTDTQLIGFLLVFLIAFSVYYAGISISGIKRGRYSGSVINTRDTGYEISDSIFFVGKTENYLFLYNLKDESAIIAPMESVTEIRLKENKRTILIP